MQEIWKPIPNYEGYYEASTKGRIKSVGRISKVKGFKINGKILKSIKGSNGYMYVSLSADNIPRRFTVHRLIALTFLENPNGYTSINHKDENKENNSVNNLEWCTSKYNTNYGTCVSRASKARMNNKAHSKPVEQIDESTGEVVCVYPSIREIMRINGYARAHISACCHGKEKRAYGYKWKFAE